MPFDKEKKNAERSLAQIREKVKELWGVDLDAVYPALVARMGQSEYRFELTPLLRDDTNGRVTLLGLEEGESLVIEGGNLYRPEGAMGVDSYQFGLESALVSPVATSGNEDFKQKQKDFAKLNDFFGVEWARIEYLFDTLPKVPYVGMRSRTYIVDFSCGGVVETGILRCFSFLLRNDWERNFALGGVVEQKKDG